MIQGNRPQGADVNIIGHSLPHVKIKFYKGVFHTMENITDIRNRIKELPDTLQAREPNASANTSQLTAAPM